jgi:muramoyltetrapeptide carboxypeptidase
MLMRGDRVSVVAPGFAVRHDFLDAGLAALRRRGFIPVEGAHLRDTQGYLAGDDAARAADLDAAIADPDTKAIWFARGGYGTARLLPLIDLARLIKRPKLLIGYSDLTALDGALLRKARAVCLHAPFVSELARKEAFHASSLAAMLAGRKAVHRIAAKDVLRPGAARGRLMGGNLTVLVHLLGTPYMPSLRGAVLFLEETGEEAYRVDRLLNHLRTSGALAGLKAVGVGQLYVPPTKREFPGDRAIDDVLRDHLLPLGIPVVRGVPSGHGAGKWTLPVGGTATLDTKAGTLELDPRPAPLPTRGR